MSPSAGLSRRQFLRGAALTGAAFQVLPSRLVFGGPDAPSNVITRAVIGTGGMGMGHVTAYPQTLAVCDVDRNRLANAVKKAGGQVKAYSDWREVLERDDIDTVHGRRRVACVDLHRRHWAGRRLLRSLRPIPSPAGRWCARSSATVRSESTPGRQIEPSPQGRASSGVLGTPLKAYLNPSNCPTGTRSPVERQAEPARAASPWFTTSGRTGACEAITTPPRLAVSRLLATTGASATWDASHRPDQYALGKDADLPSRWSLSRATAPHACGLSGPCCDLRNSTIRPSSWGGAKGRHRGRAGSRTQRQARRNGTLEPANLAE